MLQAYRDMEAKGIIGKMMKVGPDGKPLYDPKGEMPGQLVPRPHVEYPKAVRRVKVKEDGSEEVLTFVATSKADELRIMSDTAELTVARSPLEKERDSLAEDLAAQQKMNGQLASQLESTLAKLEELSNKVAKMEVNAKPATQPTTQHKGLGGLSAEQRALANKT